VHTFATFLTFTAIFNWRRTEDRAERARNLSSVSETIETALVMQ
jgi:hypothetical protein